MRNSLFICALAFSALALQGQVVFDPNAARVVGQPSLTVVSSAPNIVEGREFNNPQSVALDHSMSPPALYVADTNNHRVLGWRNSAAFENGAFADIVIGQRDMFSTSMGGPGTAFRMGLRSPTGVIVDQDGNLYVADAGNNRVLRFRRPFEQSETIEADMVIGQPDFDNRQPNTGGRSASSMQLASFSNSPFRVGMAFDSSGNLFVSDPGNHRILKYSASKLSTGTNGPAADIAIGQKRFEDAEAIANNAGNRVSKVAINTPSGIAFDQGGRLFVADALSRVLVFLPPFHTGMEPTRILGVLDRPPGSQITPVNGTDLNGPEGVFMIGPNPAVADYRNNRIMVYPPFDEWPAEAPPSISSPAARQVIGQLDFITGTPKTTASNLAGPVAAVFSGTELFIADSANNRVVVMPAPSFDFATRLLGQIDFSDKAANLLEGRELFIGAGPFPGGGLAVDATADPPILYVADTFNNRILVYRNARRVRPGDRADFVIGQPALSRSDINYPNDKPDEPSATGLYRPTGLAVDAEGNLFVADSGNSRVLRFPKPSEVTEGTMHQADLVLGQSDFTGLKISDPSSKNLSLPFGLALTPEGHLFVSDSAHHRVLLFRKPEGGDFLNGMAAQAHFGQESFTSATAGSDESSLRIPRGITSDSSGRLYVADSGNNRILIFSGASAADDRPQPPGLGITRSTSAGATLQLPTSVHISPQTGEIFVTETNASRVLRYPEFSMLAINNYLAFPNQSLQAFGALFVTFDGLGNPLVSESTNRVSFFFPGGVGVNSGNYFIRPLSPGSYVSVFPVGAPFAFQETQTYHEVSPNSLPIELAGIQVLVDDTPVPLQYVSPMQINFLLPMNAPTSGTVRMLIHRPATGQIIASGPLTMDIASPGLFTADGTGRGQLAAFNENGTLNSSTNPAARGSVIRLFGTGAGFIPGAPPDGQPATLEIPTEQKPLVYMEQSTFVPEANVLYSGLAQGMIGVWEIRVRIPSGQNGVSPGDNRRVFVQIRDRSSQPVQTLVTTIAVKE